MVKLGDDDDDDDDDGKNNAGIAAVWLVEG
jgi:hypothetical protein